MSENQNPTFPPQGGENQFQPIESAAKLSFEAVYNKGVQRRKEAEREIIERYKKSFRDRFSQMREAIKSGWGSVKDTGRKIHDAFLFIDALVEDPEVREDMRTYISDRIEEGRERTKRKIGDIREDFDNKREAAKDTALGIVRAIKREVTERVITPTAEGAKKVGAAVVSGAEKGVLFVASPAIMAYEAGKAGVEAGKAGVEAGKQLIDNTKTAAKERIKQATEKARDWANRLGNFFVEQGNQVKGTIQGGIAEIQATGLTLSTIPDELGLRLINAELRRETARTQKEIEYYNNVIQELQQQLKAAIENRELMLRERGIIEKALAGQGRRMEKRIKERKEEANNLRQAARDLRLRG